MTSLETSCLEASKAIIPNMRMWPSNIPRVQHVSEYYLHHARARLTRL